MSRSFFNKKPNEINDLRRPRRLVKPLILLGFMLVLSE